MVQSSQVETLQANAGHPVLDLFRPKLRRLLLLLDQPVERNSGCLLTLIPSIPTKWSKASLGR